jgi:hypothetical protein
MSDTLEYYAWNNAQVRCDPTNVRYKTDYAERGITFYEGWKGKTGFQKFIEHIGLRPSDKGSLDRIDNNRGYEPGNVQWATAKDQAANRRIKRIENFSDAAFNEEAEKRGYSRTPVSVVYRAVTFSANAPTVGNVVLVDASK